MARTIGIDLGTTNSCVSFMENGRAVVIPNAEGGRTTPSVVAFTKSGERLVGMTAKRQAVTNASRTFSSVKRDMGSDKRFQVDGKSYTPQEISAMILQKLKADAEAYIGETVTDAVITVPAYFSDAQRQATKDAGLIAGLNVLRIINEPTSAALAYGFDKGMPCRVMVYDLGGGTFDVSILEINSDTIEVLATAGNNHLGGDDFDQCIVGWLLEEFRKEHHVDISKDPMAMQRLAEAAEKAKIELSASTSTVINLPFLAQNASGPMHLECTLTRARFDDLTAHLVSATRGPVQQAMQDAGVKASDLSRVLLVGGSTRIPAVQEEVRKLTGKEPARDINPDECVAMGACLQGGVLTGTVNSIVLIDVTPLSLGIETLGDVFAKIIDRNSPLPCQHSQVFTTAANFQTSVEINVLQGEREIASANKSLGKFRLTGIRRALRGIPQIEVTFSIDTNGIVHVTARDLGTNRSQDITISGSGNMSREEIDRAIRDAQRYAAEDKQRKQSQQAKDAAENLLNQAKRARKKLKDDDKSRLDSSIAALEAAIRANDEYRMKTASEDLDTILRSVGTYTSNPEGENDDGAYDA
ncbi:molecular chaperone DnaK [Aristaeella lactis]|uniref:Molecular chaperone DnaK n=1 Tax=Aristaeella lactis TaxID=3046383 RepID=A0AC61PJ03_9FIRM|nr:molecular chaperone DnaK [Aristaeella lactis]QUA53991.1 molecular chaperone DnaK [Aristaeella lactis]SMC42029.1 molecular chaperone DnaK [Aristaeella lactis]